LVIGGPDAVPQKSSPGRISTGNKSLLRREPEAEGLQKRAQVLPQRLHIRARARHTDKDVVGITNPFHPAKVAISRDKRREATSLELPPKLAPYASIRGKTNRILSPAVLEVSGTFGSPGVCLYPFFQPSVHLVEVDVGEKWAQDGSLRGTLPQLAAATQIHHTTPQPFPEKLGDRFRLEASLRKEGHQTRVIDGVEAPLDVHLQKPRDPAPIPVDFVERRVAPAAGSEAVAVLRKCGVKEGLEHRPQRLLGDLVPKGSDRQRALSFGGLRDIFPAGWGEGEGASAKPPTEVLQESGRKTVQGFDPGSRGHVARAKADAAIGRIECFRVTDQWA
jgi:hypothetical protein